MIEFSRALARQFRAVLRRSLMASEPRGPWPVIQGSVGKDGLTLRAVRGDVAVQHVSNGDRSSEALAFPGALLANCEGRSDAPVAVETTGPEQCRARWTDGGVPRVVEFAAIAPDGVPAFPALPTEFVTLPATFVQALGEAARTAARDAPRLGLTRVQLRSKAGKVVATDGRHLLVQGGFTLPWSDDVLVPCMPVFGSRELPWEEPVEVGRTDSHLAVRLGPWTFLLAIDKSSRFPDIQSVIPRPAQVTSRLQLDPQDAAFLQAIIPKLPGHDHDHAPVTLDLNTPVAVRARGEGLGPVTEAVLARSTVTGPPVRLNVSRQHLLRALQLGFTEVEVIDAEKPSVCRDKERIYVWMPLDPKEAIRPGSDLLRLSSTEAAAAAGPALPPERRIAPMPAPPDTNGSSPESPRPAAVPDRGSAIDDVIAEVEDLRTVLQDASGRVVRLLAALKQQRRQSRAVRAAVASLRQLQLEP